MERTSSNTLSPFSLASYLVFLLIDLLFIWGIGFKKFFSTSRRFFQSQTEFVFSKSNVLSERKLSADCKYGKPAEDDGTLSRDDVEMVMRKLGFTSNREEERLGSSELLVLFEDEEPSVEEVKEAFDVFDVNRDGFVDATELHRVLCSLGFTKALKMEECEKMIRVFDENRDGRIDFKEFVKLMEKSFCY